VLLLSLSEFRMYKPLPKPKRTQKHLTEEEIRSYFPDEPFLLVFGSSHSHGSCTGPDGKAIIAKENKWTTIVSDHYGLPVVNLALPGVTNQQIVTMMLDVADRGLMKNAKLVLGEVRSGMSGGYFSRDVFGGWITGREFNNPEMTGGSDIWASTYLSDKFILYAPLLRNEKPNYFEGLLKSIWEDPPQEAVDDLRDYVEKQAMFFHNSNHQLFDNFQHIRTMDYIVRNQNVPFKWFAWSRWNPKIPEPKSGKWATGGHNETYFYFNEFTNVFENALFEHGLVTIAEQQGIDESKWLCDCKHWNEEGNKWVASQIIPKLKTIL